MSMILTCPQGHEWREETSPQARTLQGRVPCPVCGALVAIAPVGEAAAPFKHAVVNTEVVDEQLEPMVAAAVAKKAGSVNDSVKPGTDDTVPPSAAAAGKEKHQAGHRHDAVDMDEDGPSVPGYYILRELGRGGMGVVYLAHQEGLDRFVALKMILGGSHSSEEDLKRFKMEAVAISRLQHPNLVTIYEVSEHNKLPYFSMEFVDGGNLDDKFAGNPMAAREAAKIIAQLARAVHYAHTKGIVHRDLKPGNVLLTTDGTPKITDFGLAKRMDSGMLSQIQSHPVGSPVISSSTPAQTHTGAIMGTPSYMAPEQASGRSKDIGPHTDTYALGAMLYELLTGRPPFMAETGWDTIVQVVEKEPLPPSHLQPWLPRDLETICLKCLEKDPAKRYATSEHLADDLERYLRHEPILARPVSRVERATKWVKRRPAFAGMIAVSILALATIITMGVSYHLELQRVASESHRRNVHLSIASGSRLLDEGDWLGALVWFTEALRIDENQPQREEMHRQRIAAVLKQCPRVGQLWFHESAIRHASFSSDGRLVATAGDDRVANIWDVATGKQIGTPLHHMNIVWQVWFSADGQRVLTGSADGTARIWDANTGKPLTEPLHHDAEVTCALFSPDGKWALTAGGDTKVQLWDAKTGKAVMPALKHLEKVVYAEFSRDGRRIVTACEDDTAYIWDVVSKERIAALKGHADNVLFAAFSPDGNLVVTTSKDQTARLWKIDKDGKAQLSVTLHHNDIVRWAAFSPDGTRVLTASDDDTAKIWSTKTGAMLAAPLRHGSNVRRYASFSPDGAWAITSSDDNTARLWDAYTGQQFTTNLVHNGTVHCAAFSSNGHHLITVSDDNVACLWDLATDNLVAAVPERREQPEEVKRGTMEVKSPDGTRRLVITKSKVEVRDAGTDRELYPALKHQDFINSACFSPDGQWFATASNDQTAQIFNVATGKQRCPPLRHASMVVKVAFSPDGTRVVTGSGDNTARIWDVVTGQMVAPPLPHRGTVVDAVFSPDGRRVATASNDQTARVWVAATGAPLSPSFQHPREVMQVSFDDDGDRLTTMTVDRVAHAWHLPRDNRPVNDLLELARLIAGSKIDEQGRSMPIDVEQVETLWKKWRGVYPEVSLASPSEVRDWRQRRVEATRAQKQWHAALWHLERLLEHKPGNADYQKARAAVQAEIDKAPSAP